jgi:hypothetical protein
MQHASAQRLVPDFTFLLLLLLLQVQTTKQHSCHPGNPAVRYQHPKPDSDPASSSSSSSGACC